MTTPDTRHNAAHATPAWEDVFPIGSCVLCHRSDDRVDTSGHCYSCSMQFQEWMEKISRYYPESYARQVAESYVYEPPFAEGK